jgi:hypothetical protein
LYYFVCERPFSFLQVRPLFENHGDVLEVALIKDRKTGEQQGEPNVFLLIDINIPVSLSFQVLRVLEATRLHVLSVRFGGC